MEIIQGASLPVRVVPTSQKKGCRRGSSQAQAPRGQRPLGQNATLSDFLRERLIVLA